MTSGQGRPRKEPALSVFDLGSVRANPADCLKAE